MSEAEVNTTPDVASYVISHDGSMSITNNPNDINIKEQLELESHRVQATILKLWMRGYSVNEIRELISVDDTLVINTIRAHRKQLSSWYKDDIEALRAERITGFRQVLKRAYDECDLTDKPAAKAQLLAIAFKAEEAIAKMQGILEINIKHQGEVTIHKLYDFDSTNFPKPQVIDAEVRELPANITNNQHS